MFGNFFTHVFVQTVLVVVLSVHLNTEGLLHQLPAPHSRAVWFPSNDITVDVCLWVMIVLLSLSRTEMLFEMRQFLRFSSESMQAWVFLALGKILFASYCSLKSSTDRLLANIKLKYIKFIGVQKQNIRHLGPNLLTDNQSLIHLFIFHFSGGVSWIKLVLVGKT